VKNEKEKRKNLKRISTTYKDYSLIHTRGGAYGCSDATLLIKKQGRTIGRITRDGTNGYRHNCYGFYKNYIISGGSNGHLKIYNLKGMEVANLVGHTGEVWSIALDGDRLVSGSYDQTIRVWDLSKLKVNSEKLKIDEKFVASIMKQYNISRKSVIRQAIKKGDINLYSNFPTLYPQLSLFTTKSNEWIAWTNEGYFNASEKGMKFIYFHLNQGAEKEAKATPLARLYDHFFRPDLIQLKLDGNETKYQEAIKGLDFKVALNNPPPTIKFDKTVSKTTKKKIKLSFSVKDETGGIGLIRVYQEGKLIKTLGNGKVNASRAVANYVTRMEQDENDIRNNKIDNNVTDDTNQTVARSGTDNNISISKLSSKKWGCY